MVKTLFAVMAMLVALPSVARAAECFYGGIAIFLGRTSDLHLTARSGQPCTISYFGATERFGFHGAAIVSRPRNGTATTQGLVVIYHPRPGYKGRDQFVYAMRGSLHGQQRPVYEARINVTVTVD